AAQEFYPYFSAYSYKYLGHFFAPNLIVWHRWTPAFFGIFAVLGMFLLVRQLFGPYAGIAASFLFSLSAPFISRSVSGFADSDAIMMFFTVFTFYLFIKTWDSGSFLFATIGGVCLGLFGISWAAYTFAPLLMFGLIGFYAAYSIGTKFLTENKNILVLVKEHFSENWKKYASFAVLLIIGLFIVGLVRGTGHINVFSALKATQIKVTEVAGFSAEGEEVRNVYKTVAEMNPATFREVVSRSHIAPFLLTIGFFALLPIGLWKRVKDHMHHVAFFSLWFAATLFMSLKATRFIEMLIVPLSIFAGISIAFSLSKVSIKKPIISIIICLSLFLTVFALPNLPSVKGWESGPAYYTTGTATAKQSGPSIGPNWYDFLAWARTETKETDIFASWWDPGHVMTAIGERPSVADGSQNGAHVHDLAITFTTTDESVAVERLKKYNVSYFYTSNDLISKYGAISFLASGSAEGYPFIYRSEMKETASGMVLIYPVSEGVQVLLNLKPSGELAATLRQGYQSQTIRKIFYYINGTGYVSEINDPDAVDAMLYLDPSFTQAIFLPPRLEGNMLTQLHFFNGQNLEHFEFVKQFGNEVKVFRVIYD
ncbi:MAG: STT3 domain-containing protein, partial [archaeon]